MEILTKCKKAILGCLFLILCFSPLQGLAKEEVFKEIGITMDVPENVTIIDADLSKWDEAWKKAGVNDAESEKKEFSSTGVLYALYPKEGARVTISYKMTEASFDIYNFSELTEDEQKDFIKDLETVDETKKVTITAEAYSKSDYPFYRILMKSTNPQQLFTEVIYGTIVNGKTLNVSVYQGGMGELDDTLAKSMVDSLKIQSITSKEEAYKAVEKQQKILVAVGLGVLVLIILFIIWFRKHRKKKRANEEEKEKANQERYTAFKEKYESIKNSGDVTPRYKNKTSYTEKVVEEFTNYDYFKRHYIAYGIAGVLLVLFVIQMLTFQQGMTQSIIMTGLIFYIVWKQFERIKKQIQIMKKSYENPVTTVTSFYDEYFIVMNSRGKRIYPYFMVKEIKVYKEFLYVYLDEHQAIYLELKGFEGHNSDACIKFLEKNIE